MQSFPQNQIINNYATEKDVIDNALRLNSRFTREDYEEVLKCLKIGLKSELKNGEHTGYNFSYLGTMYIKFDNLTKNFVTNKRSEIKNWQIRFEKVYREIINRTLYRYKNDLRVRKGKYHHLKREYGFVIEDLERIQNEEFNK